jgi:hypothetical protein
MMSVDADLKAGPSVAETATVAVPAPDAAPGQADVEVSNQHGGEIPADDTEDLFAIETELVPGYVPTTSPSKLRILPDFQQAAAGQSPTTHQRSSRPDAEARRLSPASPERASFPSTTKPAKAQILREIHRIEEEMVAVQALAVTPSASHSPAAESVNNSSSSNEVQPHSTSTEAAEVDLSDAFDGPTEAAVNISLHSDPGSIPVVPHLSVAENHVLVAHLDAPDDEVKSMLPVALDASPATTSPDPPALSSEVVKSDTSRKPVSIPSNDADAATAAPSETTPEKALAVDAMPEPGKVVSPLPSPANSEPVLSNCGACVVL